QINKLCISRRGTSIVLQPAAMSKHAAAIGNLFSPQGSIVVVNYFLIFRLVKVIFFSITAHFSIGCFVCIAAICLPPPASSLSRCTRLQQNKYIKESANPLLSQLIREEITHKCRHTKAPELYYIGGNPMEGYKNMTHTMTEK